MKKIITLALLGFMCYSINAQMQLYMSELIGKTYKAIVDPEDGRYRLLQFVDPDGDGWAAGIQEEFVPNPDPEEAGHMIPIYDEMYAFEITEKEGCGNCMIFKGETFAVSYYTIHHEEGDFWLQQTDEKFEKSNEKILFKPFEKPLESSGPQILTATASSSDRYHDWGDAPDEGGWVVPMAAGGTFTGESVSSVLPEDENFDYIMENAFDDNPYTTWFSDPEKNGDYPSGESIVFIGSVYNETIWILNGMQYSEEDFENNSRVKTMEVHVNGTLFATVTLLDQMGSQQIYLEGINEYQPDGAMVKIEFRVVDVYPGKEYPEAGISEIYTVGG
ncbi:MAG: hypothetical protein IPO32_19410 [Crocinitomicaceae bacterium]|nr:hypothetical protein [Crocinitomicaceae bacterium]